jgi:RND family efflux transporter MFP subunit
VRGLLRSFRLSLRFLLGRRLGLFLAVDALVLGRALWAMLLSSSGDSIQVYRFLFLLPSLALALPALAGIVDLERRAGCLDLALSAPGAEAYFVRRAGAVAALAAVQGWLLLLRGWLAFDRSFPLLPDRRGEPLPRRGVALLGGPPAQGGGGLARLDGHRARGRPLALLRSHGTAAARRTPALLPQPRAGAPLARERRRAGGRGRPLLPLCPRPATPARTAALVTGGRMRSPFRLPLRPALAILLPALLAACAPPAEVPADPPLLPVGIERLERRDFQPTLVLLGVVRPSREAEVVIPAAGRLHYPARFAAGLSSGAAVRAGEMLAELDDGASTSDLAEARLRLESARVELARFQRGFDSGVVSGAQLASYKATADLAAQQLDAAQGRHARLALRSPVAGFLSVEKAFPDGGEVPGGAVLARVAAAGRPRVEARAAAGARAALHPGLKARFVLAGAPGAVGSGIVRDIPPMLDAGGTVPVGIEAVDGAALPAAGEGVVVHVELDLRPAAITVPEEALLVSEAGSAVFLVQGTQALHRAVTLGARGGGRVEVTSGLSPGDRVVVEGIDLLTDGARVEAVEKPAADPAEADEESGR